jgi:WYL domain
VSSAGWTCHARVRVHAPAEAVTARLPPAAILETVDERTCMLDIGADTPAALAVRLGTLGVDFEVSQPPELVAHLRELADRYARATR